MIFLSNHYGHLIRVLHWCTHQSMSHALEQMELTAAQGHVMGFLARTKEPPCPRDIEAEFQLTHPTVSGLLSRLEQKSFIELRTDPEDRRCKRIYVLPKGRECQETMYAIILENERRLVQDFTEEEKELFASLLRRGITNMGGSPYPKHKEEPKP